MRIRVFACLLSLTASCLFAQPAEPRVAFDVASIKPAEAPKSPGVRVGMSIDKAQVHFSNVSLRDMIMRAYSVRTYQVTGPDWLNSVRFDVVAKIPEGASRDQVPGMLQTLLEDRFKLKLHREQKELPVYALIVGKNGPKLKKADADGNVRMSMGPKGRELTAKLPLARFAEVLSNMVDRPVIDMTEIAGSYDITLDWASGDNSMMALGMGAHEPPPGGPAAGKMDDDATGPSIYTAVQEQLGLKLDARKAPLDVLTIDSVEKIPTEN